MSDFTLLAPFSAWAGSLAEVPDEAFANGLVGDGLALDPLEGMVRAPCDGVVTAIAPTGHSLTMRHASGCEILVHIGIDTVELKGRGFELLTAVGQAVNAGDQVLRFDIDLVARDAKSLMTPLVVLADDARLENRVTGRRVASGEPIATVHRTLRHVTAGQLVAQSVATASRTLHVGAANGLHARPSARIVAALKRLDTEVIVRANGRQGNARSLTSLLKLNVAQGDVVSIEASGRDAEAAVEALAGLILGSCDDETIDRPPASAQTLRADMGNHLAGVRAAPGGAMGIATRLDPRDLPVPETRGSTVEELELLDSAIAILQDRLHNMAQVSEIVAAHLSLLEDPEMKYDVEARIAAGTSAPAAWRAATREGIIALESTGNPLLIERAADLLDVERQLLAVMLDAPVEPVALPPNAILVTEDLSPSAFFTLDLDRVVGIVSAAGGPTSHAAILAASKGIPMVVGCGPQVLAIASGTPLLIDLDTPVVHVAPDEATVAAFSAQSDLRWQQDRLDAEAAREDCFTADGARIQVFANCGSREDATEAVNRGAEGCGLLRTEFLFLDRSEAPSREEQQHAYASIAEALGDLPLIVRTLDAGSDKPLAYLPMPSEENPALGTRGIRLALARPELLEDQFSAILQAIPAPRRRIMLPMVVDLGEFRAARALLQQVERRLGITEPTQLGVMVETPASALLADQLAREADFLSIGSNDLAQYVLAADRQNPALAASAQALHPAVLRLIRSAAEGAHEHRRWLGLCGSLASDPMAAALLVGLGVDELSATPRKVPAVKAHLRRTTLDACRRLADIALDATSAGEVEGLIREHWNALGL